MTRPSTKALYYLIPLLMGTIASCIRVPRNAFPLNARQISVPKIDVPITVSVGERMVHQGTIVEERALIVHEEVDGISFTVPAGEYVHVGFNEKYDFYDKGDIIHNETQHAALALAVEKGQTSRLKVMIREGGATTYESRFTKGTVISAKHDSFQQTLIYSGRIGSKVNISYREFSNNKARASFNNDVEYDLDASKVIGYMGVRLDIIEATNSSITFKLISNFK